MHKSVPDAVIIDQDERLVLALMSLAFRLEDMGERVGGLCAEFGGEEKKA